jgi:hypothetical protein
MTISICARPWGESLGAALAMLGRNRNIVWCRHDSITLLISRFTLKNNTAKTKAHANAYAWRDAD